MIVRIGDSLYKVPNEKKVTDFITKKRLSQINGVEDQWKYLAKSEAFHSLTERTQRWCLEWRGSVSRGYGIYSGTKAYEYYWRYILGNEQQVGTVLGHTCIEHGCPCGNKLCVCHIRVMTHKENRAMYNYFERYGFQAPIPQKCGGWILLEWITRNLTSQQLSRGAFKRFGVYVNPLVIEAYTRDATSIQLANNFKEVKDYFEIAEEEGTSWILQKEIDNLPPEHLSIPKHIRNPSFKETEQIPEPSF